MDANNFETALVKSVQEVAFQLYVMNDTMDNLRK